MTTNQLDLPEIDKEKLLFLVGGHIFFQTLSAAVQLDLFSLISKQGPMTRADIAAHLGIDEHPARILLLGCTTLGLLCKDGSLYSNSKVAHRYLNADDPGNIIAVVKFYHFVTYKPMYSFYDSIKSNRNVGLEEHPGTEGTLYERLAHNKELEQLFQDAMHGLSVQINADFVRLVDLSHVNHLLDVGGGDGTNVIALARKYAQMQATVFDLPHVCDITRKNIEAAGLAGRLDAVAGNCFIDPFIPNIDCILFAHFFSIWSEAQHLSLLRKCFEVLPKGGSVVIFGMMQHDDETGPLRAAFGSPYFLTLATGHGMVYTWKEYESWMREAGFTTVLKQSLPDDYGVITGIKE